MGLFEASEIWMHVIGKTIIHSLWIGLIILALLRLARAYVPVNLSRLRYSIAVSALLLLFVLVIASFLMLYEPLSSMQASLSSPRVFSLVSGKLFLKSHGESVLDTNLLFSLCGYIYFAGALFMLSRSMVSLSYVRRLKSSGFQPDQEWQEKFLQISRSLGIKRPVKFLESALASGPMLVGYLKPAVIVPAGMITLLPISQVETILMHELYHLKRRDYLVNIMQLFIEGILFYHPVVWIISGFIRSEREHCCDDRVLHATDNPETYAKALIHIAEQQQFTRLAPGAVGSKKHHFHSRIMRILNYHTMKTNMRDKVLSLTLLAGSIIILLTVSGFSAEPGFFSIDKSNSQRIAEVTDPLEIAVPDTIPEERHHEELEELDEADWEVMKVEIEAAHQEALQEIEEIDWEEIKVEMEQSLSEMKIDLEEIKEIDWESMKEEMEAARLEIEEIDWEEVRAEMDQSFSEMKLDMEEVRREIENSMNEIDWDEIREDIKEDMEKVKLSLDSIRIEMDL